MYRRLKNFAADPGQEEVYRELLGLDVQQYFEVLTQVDLHPTLRLVQYLRAFEIISRADPSRWAFDLHERAVRFKDLLETQYYACRDVKLAATPIDPLQICEDGPFQRRHRLLQLEKQVGLDINRLFSTEVFFVDPKTRADCQLLTTLWCHCVNGDVYKQGIHEIFALCYQIAIEGVRLNFLVHRQDSDLFHLAHFVQANVLQLAYDMGASLMAFVYPLYADDRQMQQRMNLIQNQLLMKLDQPLNERIQQLNLESVYLIRWLRLLFCREVQVCLVPRLWDFVVFSLQKDRGTDYLDYLVISFYQARRTEIMRNDYNDVMRMFSGSLLGDLNAEGVEKVCQNALKLMGLRKEQDSKARQILGAVQKAPQQQQFSKKAQIHFYLSKQIRDGIQLAREGNPLGFQQLEEVADLLEVLIPEHEDTFLDILRAGGEVAVQRSRALEVVTDCIKRAKGWAQE